MAIDLLRRLLKESWMKVETLSNLQVARGFRPFRKIGDEAWIVAELYHQLKMRMEANALNPPEFFLTTEIKPNGAKSIDLGIIRTDMDGNEVIYQLFLEVKH